MQTTQSNFKFTRDWSTYHYRTWNRFTPTKVLEIGSFEGRSALYWAQRPTTEAIACVDTWDGGEEHSEINFKQVEEYFDHNASFFPSISKVKMQSSYALAIFITARFEFDWIYIDGSHKAPDVLTDAVMAFQLLTVGGHMVFDDYMWYDSYRFEEWGEAKPPVISSYPKPAIDSFINLFYDQLRIIHLGRQIIVERLK